MNAANPAAGAAFAFQEFFARPLDAAIARFDLFGVFYPTYKFIAGKRGNVSPQRQHLPIFNDRLL
jgi:hypothetical protein